MAEWVCGVGLSRRGDSLSKGLPSEGHAAHGPVEPGRVRGKGGAESEAGRGSCRPGRPLAFSASEMNHSAESEQRTSHELTSIL